MTRFFYPFDLLPYPSMGLLSIEQNYGISCIPAVYKSVNTSNSLGHKNLEKSTKWAISNLMDTLSELLKFAGNYHFLGEMSRKAFLSSA